MVGITFNWEEHLSNTFLEIIQFTILTSVHYVSLTDAVPARVVLYMMSFTGFLVSFMMRTDINIAMVAMVRFQSSGNSSSSNGSQPYCYGDTVSMAVGNTSGALFNETFVEKPNVSDFVGYSHRVVTGV